LAGENSVAATIPKQRSCILVSSDCRVEVDPIVSQTENRRRILRMSIPSAKKAESQQKSEDFG
jgi:hypothetical protein